LGRAPGSELPGYVSVAPSGLLRQDSAGERLLSFPMLTLRVIVAVAAAFLPSFAAVAQCDAHSAVPVPNAPYSAVRRLITMKRNADGTLRRSEATEQEARDSKGRSYRAGERRWTTNIDGKSVVKSEMLVRISDPIANIDTTWDTTSKEVRVVYFQPSDAANKTQVKVDAFSWDASAKRLNATSLGSKTIDGLSVQGIAYRTNNSTHECWFSPELQTVVLQTDEYGDGNSTNRLENVRRAEPDVESYKPPASYSVKHVYFEQSSTSSKR
jgi:hypothetical protein